MLWIMPNSEELRRIFWESILEKLIRIGHKEFQEVWGEGEREEGEIYDENLENF